MNAIAKQKRGVRNSVLEGVSVKTVGRSTTVTPTSGDNRTPVEIFFDGKRYGMSYSPGPKSNVSGQAADLDTALNWAKRVLDEYKDFVAAPVMSGTSRQIMMHLQNSGGRQRIDPAHASMVDELVKKKLVTLSGNMLAFTTFGAKVAKSNF